MRDRAWLDFVKKRVLAEMRENPSIRPYLGEEDRRKPGPKPSVPPDEKRRRKNERQRIRRAMEKSER